jgi:hypothetical protein
MSKTVAKDKIRKVLADAISRGYDYQAIHELHLEGVSECSASARLREMARANPPEVIGRVREGTKFKEWKLAVRP